MNNKGERLFSDVRRWKSYCSKERKKVDKLAVSLAFYISIVAALVCNDIDMCAMARLTSALQRRSESGELRFIFVPKFLVS